jgi:death-on-curing family protein
MSEIQRLSEDEVLLVRRRMASLDIATQDAFGLTQPLHPDKLSSAVFRQFTGAGGVYKYTTVPDVGANLFYGVAMSHAFENGNKRTALVSLLVFLDKNKTFVVDAGEDDLYELARSVAAHEITIEESKPRNADTEILAVASWIRSHTRQISLGDSAMEFKELRQTLEVLGCTFDKPEKNFVKIRHGTHGNVKTGYPRANFEIAVSEIKRIRKGLRLDEAHGLDSTGFYSLEGKVDDFVNTYRNLMKRLADL